mmetsp:Transcript_14759/g.17278  ORF Transcript_14759/g.17278 Transcript_14759/m.17278 type:complete len:913 (-) Transcript_14759:142-2880(-)
MAENSEDINMGKSDRPQDPHYGTDNGVELEVEPEDNDKANDNAVNKLDLKASNRTYTDSNPSTREISGKNNKNNTEDITKEPTNNVTGVDEGSNSNSEQKDSSEKEAETGADNGDELEVEPEANDNPAVDNKLDLDASSRMRTDSNPNTREMSGNDNNNKSTEDITKERTNNVMSGDEDSNSNSGQMDSSGKATETGKDSVEEKKNAEMVTLKIKLLDGNRTLQEEILLDSLETDVKDLRELLSSRFDIEFGRLRLIFKGQVLKDGNHLSDYGCDAESTLHAVARPVGVEPSPAPDSGYNATTNTNTNTNTGQPQGLQQMLSGVISMVANAANSAAGGLPVPPQGISISASARPGQPNITFSSFGGTAARRECPHELRLEEPLRVPNFPGMHIPAAMSGWSCNHCGHFSTGPAMQCRQCDFHLCPACYRRRNENRQHAAAPNSSATTSTPPVDPNNRNENPSTDALGNDDNMDNTLDDLLDHMEDEGETKIQTRAEVELSTNGSTSTNTSGTDMNTNTRPYARPSPPGASANNFPLPNLPPNGAAVRHMAFINGRPVEIQGEGGIGIPTSGFPQFPYAIPQMGTQQPNMNTGGGSFVGNVNANAIQNIMRNVVQSIARSENVMSGNNNVETPMNTNNNYGGNGAGASSSTTTGGETHTQNSGSAPSPVQTDTIAPSRSVKEELESLGVSVEQVRQVGAYLPTPLNATTESGYDGELMEFHSLLLSLSPHLLQTALVRNQETREQQITSEAATLRRSFARVLRNLASVSDRIADDLDPDSVENNAQSHRAAITTRRPQTHTSVHVVPMEISIGSDGEMDSQAIQQAIQQALQQQLGASGSVSNNFSTNNPMFMGNNNNGGSNPDMESTNSPSTPTESNTNRGSTSDMTTPANLQINGSGLSELGSILPREETQ